MTLETHLHCLANSANDVINFSTYIFNTYELRLPMAEVDCEAPTLTCIRKGKALARLKAGEQERRYWYQVDQLHLEFMMGPQHTEATKKELANKRGKEYLEYGKPQPTTLIGTSSITGKYLVAIDGPCVLELIDPNFSALSLAHDGTPGSLFRQ